MHQLNKSEHYQSIISNNVFVFFFCCIIFIDLPKKIRLTDHFPVFQVRTRTHGRAPDFWVSGGSEFHTAHDRCLPYVCLNYRQFSVGSLTVSLLFYYLQAKKLFFKIGLVLVLLICSNYNEMTARNVLQPRALTS